VRVFHYNLPSIARKRNLSLEWFSGVFEGLGEGVYGKNFHVGMVWGC